jgi:hypothetical protein
LTIPVEGNTLSVKAQFQDETAVDRVTFAVSLVDRGIKVTSVLVNGEPINPTHISNGVFVSNSRSDFRLILWWRTRMTDPNTHPTPRLGV